MKFNADICIIQECENPFETKDKEYKKYASNYLWVGDSKNKGLGIFAAKNLKLQKLNWTNVYESCSAKYFLPCLVDQNFYLLAVWTHRNGLSEFPYNGLSEFPYIGQFWQYFQIHKKKLNKVQTIIAGDFNSNSIWDKPNRCWNHSNIVRELEVIGIQSLYHKFNNEEQGKEKMPTFYFQKKLEKPYHIDYIFGSKDISNRLKNFVVGNHEDWLKISDHLPIICEFENHK